VPPRPLSTAPATPPAGLPPLERDVTVVLLVTIDKDGKPSDIGVAESGGAPLDEAATAALRTWLFSPATRDGHALASRIKVPFRFVASPPSPPATGPQADHEGASTPARSAPALAPAARETPPPRRERDAPIEVDVRGRRPPESRNSSDFTLDRELLVAAPRRDAADLLSAAPGVYVAKAEGDAVAHEIFLRGFDAAHG